MLVSILVAQRFPQRHHVVREIALFDHGIRPHGTHESVLGDQAAVVRYQDKKGVEYLCPERHGLPVLQQAALNC